MKRVWNKIRKYWLPLTTAGLALLLVLCWLFPNRVLDTYEMNLTGPEEKEWITALPEGIAVSYTMNTGARPLRGIQPGISLQGGKYTNARLRCQVFREPSGELVSDNVCSLAELTQNMQASLDGGADSSLSLEPMYTYIPFADYEKCKGDIMLVFSYESNGDTPELFDGITASEPVVPGLLLNEVQKENTQTCRNGEPIEGGLCGYQIYTHNTYPLLYDLRLLLCVFLAASVSGTAGTAWFRHVKGGKAGAAWFRRVMGGQKERHLRARGRLLRGILTCVSVIAAAALVEIVFFQYHAIAKKTYREPLTGSAAAVCRMRSADGREKLTAEEENTILRNRENARILAELNGTEYTAPAEEGIVEEADGFYRKVKRTWIEITLPKPQYIHTLRIALPETAEGNTVTIQADGRELAEKGWIDERIGQGSYLLDTECQELTLELTGTEELLGDKDQIPIQVTAENLFSFHPVRFLFLLSVFALAVFFAGSWGQIFEKKPELVFALCSLILGSVLIYAVGLNQVGYDEHIHLKTAYERSFGATVLTTESAMQMEGSTMPSFRNMAERRLTEAYAEKNHDFSWANITHQSRFPNYDVRSYLQISLFLWLGRLLHLPFVWCMMLGKFGNLLLYTAVCALAVRLAKQGKILAAALALLPNSIFAAASFSYDAVVNSFLLLAVVLCFNQMLTEERINWGQTLALLGSFLAGSTAKPIYIFMAFLLLLCSGKKFGGRWQALVYKLCVVSLMALLLYTFFFPPVSASSNYEVMGNLAYAGDKRSQGTSVLGQIAWILHHPAAYAGLLLRSMFGELWNYLSGARPFVAYGYLGGLPVVWTWLGAAALFMAAGYAPQGEERKALPARFLVGNGLVVLGMSAVIWTSMYVTFTAVGADVINGVQGRYFLPLFLPFFGCFFRAGHQVRLNRENYAKLILSVFVLMNLYGTWTLAILPCSF